MMPGDGERAWARVLAAFDDVVDLDPAARRVRLDAIGATDSELRRALEQLLAADSRADVMLARFDGVLGEPMQDGDPLHLVGRIVSHFRVMEPLARGGMGLVYRAEDLELARPVALKVPLAAHYLDPAAKHRFRQEARTAAALDHPNLCPVYETGETSAGDLFYTMPLYEGETLKTRLSREGSLPLTAALDIAAQLARGLGAAHQAGIVHRDLKPANVMLLPDGAVKILDFGLAKASDVSLTVSWARLGTIAYMAPEQIHGHEVDRRADLWALGVVLFEMVTGRRPFIGGHEIGTAHAIVHEPPPLASALRDEIPGELDDVIEKCLCKDPAGRFQSADELEAGLGRIELGGRTPSRRRRSLGRIVHEWRSPRRASLLGAVTLLAAAGGAVMARRSATVLPVTQVSLAVVPFDGPGNDGGADHLAVGLSDALGTDLSRLRGVVVPRYVTTSVYRGSPKTAKQIAAEQQVGAVLRGSVQQVGTRVQVDAQLFDTSGGPPLWARRYERPMGELPELERDILRATAASLRVRPAELERAFLGRPATTSARAYDLYLQGRAKELEGMSREDLDPIPTASIRPAQALYSQARDLDPRFASARARLALMHALAAAAYDTAAARREQAHVEAEAALRLEPGLPEAHEALASVWALEGDLPKAIEELRLALDSAPNSVERRVALADLLGRAGRFDDAVAENERAMKLEPGSPTVAFRAALYYSRMRRREEAMRAFDRAIAVAPEYHMVKVIKGQAYLRWTGMPDTLAAAMETVPADWDPNGMATYARYTALWVQRRYADALDMLERSRCELSHDGHVYQPISLMRARLQEGLGHRKLARASYATARSVLQDSVDAHPADPAIRISLALAYAGLGRASDAVREARRAMGLVHPGRSTVEATAVMGGAVEAYAEAGEIGAALNLLELLFSMPAGREVSAPFLRAWPGFDPLRKDPRFDELLTRFAAAT
jgi:TolB-like protein/Tfp pilus assembly protein PilF